MKIDSKTSKYGDHKRLVIAKDGITVEYRRPQVGGGTYVENHITFPWPWKRED